MDDNLPDLVRDWELETSHVGDKKTIHTTYVSDPSRGTWRRSEDEVWDHSAMLGRGSFGVVSLQKCVSGHNSGRVRAVKEIQVALDQCSNKFLSREISAIVKFSHQRFRECFVPSFGWYRGQDYVFITMEYLPMGDLQSYLDSPLPDTEARAITEQILQGIDFMHQSKFAHRDLKPKNILVQHKGPRWWVKISDFGCSKQSEATSLRTIVGTEPYLAPELQNIFTSLDEADLEDEDDSDSPETSAYSHAVDIWALGAITFRLATGQVPFPSPVGKKLFRYVAQGGPFPPNELLSTECGAFVLSAMSRSPRDRPTATQALNQPWIVSGRATQMADPIKETGIATEQEADPNRRKNSSQSMSEEAPGSWPTVRPSLPLRQKPSPGERESREPGLRGFPVSHGASGSLSIVQRGLPDAVENGERSQYANTSDRVGFAIASSGSTQSRPWQPFSRGYYRPTVNFNVNKPTPHGDTSPDLNRNSMTTDSTSSSNSRQYESRGGADKHAHQQPPPLKIGSQEHGLDAWVSPNQPIWAFSIDGRWLLSATIGIEWKTMVHVWRQTETCQFEQINSHALGSFEQLYLSLGNIHGVVSLSNNRKFILAHPDRGDNNCIEIWKFNDRGDCSRGFMMKLYPGSYKQQANAPHAPWCSSADGRRAFVTLYTGHDSATICIIDSYPDGRCDIVQSKELGIRPEQIACSPRGEYYALFHDGKCTIFHTEYPGRFVFDMPESPQIFTSNPPIAIFSPGGRWCVVSGFGRFSILKRGEGNQWQYMDEGIFQPWTGEFSTDSKSFVLCSRKGAISIWRLDEHGSFIEAEGFQIPAGFGLSFAKFSPGGQFLATAAALKAGLETEVWKIF